MEATLNYFFWILLLFTPVVSPFLFFAFVLCFYIFIFITVVLCCSFFIHIFSVSRCFSSVGFTRHFVFVNYTFIFVLIYLRLFQCSVVLFPNEFLLHRYEKFQSICAAISTPLMLSCLIKSINFSRLSWTHY